VNRSMKVPQARGGVGRWLWRAFSALALPGLVLGALAVVIQRERVDAARQWEQQQATQRARVDARQALLARGDLGEILGLCRDGWRDEFHFHHEPTALAWSRTGLDGYFREGGDAHSLRQLRCDSRGVTRGPRVAYPLRDRLPAEAPNDRTDAAAEAWQLALQRVTSRPLGEGELAVEILAHPLTSAVLTRRWRAGEAGAVATVEPADAPAFDLLVAAPAFGPARGSASSALRPLARHHWLAEADAAFAVIGSALPPRSRIAEITLTDDAIELRIEAQTRAFDGRPPVPYGDKAFDEYGIAEADWWYPREDSGFGCRRGQSLAQVQAAFSDARTRFAGQPLARAWYSCSTAFSNGRDGVWHLQAR
jgi:hypothetical protein